jgi:hypothetical protein
MNKMAFLLIIVVWKKLIIMNRLLEVGEIKNTRRVPVEIRKHESLVKHANVDIDDVRKRNDVERYGN